MDNTTQQQQQPERIVRKDELIQRLGIALPTLWKWTANGSFPRPFKLAKGSRVVGWKASTIDEWFATRGKAE